MGTHETTEHILPLGLYLKIGGALLALTIVTVWVAQYNLGAMNLVVAMLIACIKGTLVALYFMHLKFGSRLYSVVFVGALLMVGVFITFTMFDTLERGRVNEIRTHLINKAVIYQSDSASDSTAAPVDSVVDSHHSN